MQVPLPRRHAAFLPILPAGILFDRGPELFRSKREPRSQPGLGALDIQANEHASDIENDCANRRGCHGSGFSGSVRVDSLARAKKADDRWKQREENYYNDDVVNPLADVGDDVPQEIAAQGHRANPKDST